MKRLTFASMALLAGAALLGGAAPATAADLPVVVRSAEAIPTFDAPPVLLSNAGTTSVSYRVDLPSGWKMAAQSNGTVSVIDDSGRLSGSFDAAWSYDQSGTSLKSAYKVSGSTLTEAVDTKSAKSFPVVVDPTYTRSGNTTDAAINDVFKKMVASPSATGGISTMAVPLGATAVKVPSGYKYNTNLKPKSLHDYCTKSPDQYDGPNKAVDFRGPCAIHDMCLERNGNGNRTPCDDALPGNMKANCSSTYASYEPLRYTCFSNAGVYWAAVTANTSIFY